MPKNHHRPKRARTITTTEGLFLNVADFKAALANERFLLECAAMIKIAHQQKHPALFGIRMCILAAIDEVTGITKMQMAKLITEQIIKQRGGGAATGTGTPTDGPEIK